VRHRRVADGGRRWATRASGQDRGVAAGLRHQSQKLAAANEKWEDNVVATDRTRRSGWITFAGVAALIAGAYNALSGIAALSDDDTLTAQAQEVLYGVDLTAWGWFWLIVGLVQLLAGVLILQRNMWGLWLGVAIACLSALMTVLVMFVFPLWAIAVLTIDFLVLFALLTESDEFTA
jgi:hypothetical protein